VSSSTENGLEIFVVDMIVVCYQVTTLRHGEYWFRAGLPTGLRRRVSSTKLKNEEDVARAG